MSRKFTRQSAWVGSIALLLVLTAVGLASAGVSGGARGDAPVKGGTLALLGQSDIFNLDTTSGYYTVDNILERSFTRQLVSYPNAPAFLAQIQLKPDVATAVPTKANGGISSNGLTYTLHIKPGVKWNTSPARQVTAADFVREFKLLCNPASPTGAPGYYESTIVGMAALADGLGAHHPQQPVGPDPGPAVADPGDLPGAQLQLAVRIGHYDEVVLGAMPLHEPHVMILIAWSARSGAS